MAEYKTVLLEKRDGIAWITLNRPERMNTIGPEMICEIISLLGELECDREVLGVIFTGAGKAFSGGMDLSGLKDDGQNPGMSKRNFVQSAHKLMNTIEEFPHPCLAAVNGFALGGGFELALACDLRISSDRGLYGLPEVTLGVIPCFGGTQRLPRLIGVAPAKDLIFTGRKVRADEAMALGIVSQVVPGEELLAAAEAKMMEILANAPLAVQLAKVAVNKGMRMPLHDALEMEADMTAILSATDDAREGGMAFFERRKAKFNNK